MKQETIKALLAKHEAGTLTDEELDLLQRLTRRDEVVAVLCLQLIKCAVFFISFIVMIAKISSRCQKYQERQYK